MLFSNWSINPAVDASETGEKGMLKLGSGIGRGGKLLCCDKECVGARRML